MCGFHTLFFLFFFSILNFRFSLQLSSSLFSCFWFYLFYICTDFWKVIHRFRNSYQTYFNRFSDLSIIYFSLWGLTDTSSTLILLLNSQTNNHCLPSTIWSTPSCTSTTFPVCFTIFLYLEWKLHMCFLLGSIDWAEGFEEVWCQSINTQPFHHWSFPQSYTPYYWLPPKQSQYVKPVVYSYFNWFLSPSMIDMTG